MARPLRIEYPGAFYHVINRGQRQEAIFDDDRDRERFLSCLGRMSSQFGVRLHAYCLMTNHYHLVVETPEANLRVPTKMNRCTENKRFCVCKEGDLSTETLAKTKHAVRGRSMEPDAVQTQNKPFECRVILLGAFSQ